MKIDRPVLVALVLAVALGWWLGHSPASPVGPPARPDRPVVKAVGRLARFAARWGLWMALAAETPPQPEDRQQLVRAPRVDADGHRVIDHAEGW